MEYEERRKAFIARVGSAEDGKASEKVVELVENDVYLGVHIDSWLS